jgi:hypothetical protein
VAQRLISTRHQGSEWSNWKLSIRIDTGLLSETKLPFYA